MHPADEFVAMASLIAAGETIEAIAVRFGTSERQVRQRLRLGKLAPELLDAYRTGEIGLDVVTAFTLGTDHVAQRRLRPRRRRPRDRWHLDEMVVRLTGRRMYLWCAVDQEGEIFDLLIQPRPGRR